MARRLMYWQVYLHKTSLIADLMLKNAVIRAKQSNGLKIENSVPLAWFCKNNIGKEEIMAGLKKYVLLDDIDVLQALKNWCSADDPILQILSSSIIHRNLFKIEFLDEVKAEAKYAALQKIYSEDEMRFLVLKGKAENNAYNPQKDNIYIKFKDGKIREITEISEQMSIRSISNPVIKHYIAYPKN